MKFEQETFDFHGVFFYLAGVSRCRLPARRGSQRYDEGFWKELLGGKEKKSKEQNLKELGF